MTRSTGHSSWMLSAARPLRTRSTVAVLTPAAAAIAWMVTLGLAAMGVQGMQCFKRLILMDSDGF